MKIFFLQISSARNFYGILSYMLFIMASTLKVFLFCYIGERLTQKVSIYKEKIFKSYLIFITFLCLIKGIDLSHKVYGLKWYDMKPESARSMLLVIIRSQKELKLTAKKFSPMTLTTYTNVNIFILMFYNNFH